MLALLDPGRYEGMKATMGDVGPWPGRTNAQEFDWREVGPSGVDLVSGVGAGAGLANLLGGTLKRIGGSRGVKRQETYKENYKNIENDPSDRAEFLNGLTNAHGYLKGEGDKTPLKDIYKTYGREFVSEDAFKNLLGGFYTKKELPGLSPSDPRFNSPGTGYRSETGSGTWTEFFRYLRDIK
jgi:hypothetical protein